MCVWLMLDLVVGDAIEVPEKCQVSLIVSVGRAVNGRSTF